MAAINNEADSITRVHLEEPSKTHFLYSCINFAWFVLKALQKLNDMSTVKQEEQVWYTYRSYDEYFSDIKDVITVVV